MPSRRRWSFYEIQEPFPRGTEHAHRPVLPVCDHPAGLSHAPALSDLLRFRRQRRAEHHQAAVRLPLPARSGSRSGHHPGALPPGGDGRTPDCERDPGRHRPLLPPHRHTLYALIVVAIGIVYPMVVHFTRRAASFYCTPSCTACPPSPAFLCRASTGC